MDKSPSPGHCSSYNYVQQERWFQNTIQFLVIKRLLHASPPCHTSQFSPQHSQTAWAKPTAPSPDAPETQGSSAKKRAPAESISSVLYEITLGRKAFQLKSRPFLKMPISNNIFMKISGDKLFRSEGSWHHSIDPEPRSPFSSHQLPILLYD